MKRLCSLLLVIGICFTFLPISAFAAEQGELSERIPISEKTGTEQTTVLPDSVTPTVEDGSGMSAETAKQLVEKTVSDNTAVQNYKTPGVKAATPTIVTALQKKTATNLSNVTDQELVSYVDIGVESVNVSKDNVITSMSFEVKPMVSATVVAGSGKETVTAEIPKDAIIAPITFRLPVDPNVPEGTIAEVFHHSSEGGKDSCGHFPVRKDGNNRFIEVSATEFSVYSYELTKIALDNPGDVLNKVEFSMSLSLQDCTKINLYVANKGNKEYQYRYSFLDETYEAQELPAGKTESVSVSCASTQYREPLTVEVYYVYGGKKVKVAEKSVSVQDYCLSVIANTNKSYSEELINLCQSVLEYGYYAQQEFKYKVERAPSLSNTDNKVSGDNSTIEGFPITWSGTPLSCVESYTASLELENYTELNVRIHMTDDSYGLEVSVSANNVENVAYSLTKDSDTVYKLHIAETPFADLDRVYHIQVKDVNNPNQVEEVWLSPMSYVQLVQNGEQKNILRALYLYYFNAKEHFK